MKVMTSFLIDGESLSMEDVVLIARDRALVEISEGAIEKVESGRDSVERLLKSGKTIYGINTGFGKLADTKVKGREMNHLQLNLIRSHAVGTGEAFSEEESRAIIAVRLNSLLRGNSGVRLDVVSQLVSFLNKRLYPCIPRYGSLGASGDLAPSAHLALSLVGEGYIFDKKGKKVESKKRLRSVGLRPLKLKAKEGLAIINGTQVMTALACLLLHDATKVFSNLDIAAALSTEALCCSMVPFDSRVQQIRPHIGQTHVAKRIRGLLKGSALTDSGHRVQDPYSIRCIPQVHGAFYDFLEYAKSIIAIELNSVTDNPIILPDTDEVLNSGNFHGQPVSLALDLLCVILAEASVYSERRIDKLLSGYNPRLELFLSQDAGLNSGLMVTQYTAASLVAENKILAKPATLESASVSAGQEDHASMGVTAALKTKTVLEHTLKVIAIEMLCAAQAIDMLGETKMGEGTSIALKEIRKISGRVYGDRSLAEDIERLAIYLKTGTIERAVNDKIQI